MVERRYLVVIDGNSPVGRLYLAGTNHGEFPSGIDGLFHPTLVCSSVCCDIPGYTTVQALRDLKESSSRAVHLPSHTVVMIHEFDSDEPAPIGFVPS